MTSPDAILKFLKTGCEHPTRSREELLDWALKAIENEVWDIGRAADSLARNRQVKEYYAEVARRKEEKAASKRRKIEVQQARDLRDQQILAARHAGETFQAIAERFGLTRGAIQLAVERTELKMRRRKPYRRAHLAQPIDPGGPRDVWLTFMPGPDARFDFMEPSVGL